VSSNPEETPKLAMTTFFSLPKPKPMFPQSEKIGPRSRPLLQQRPKKIKKTSKGPKQLQGLRRVQRLK
jgi:hypothetical protein